MIIIVWSRQHVIIGVKSVLLRLGLQHLDRACRRCAARDLFPLGSVFVLLMSEMFIACERRQGISKHVSFEQSSVLCKLCKQTQLVAD